MPAPPRRVLLLGATGTIGRAAARALVTRGHSVVCPVRRRAPAGLASSAPADLPEGCEPREAHVLDATSLDQDGFRGQRFDAVVSCLASRTGAASDAWAVDHGAHVHALQLAQARGVSHFVYLSALCVQKPQLAFQHAKLAFEHSLATSGLSHSIVRPTAFFKSLSGQVARVRAGKPFLVFGDGQITACKPIADEDLADFLVDCVERPAEHLGVRPVGGPGPAITPRMQAQMLQQLLGRPVALRRVPLAVLDAAGALLGAASHVVPALAGKAELARIGRYYATESMLVWDDARQRYDADATPSYGSRTLAEHYARLLDGRAEADLGDHAVF